MATALLKLKTMRLSQWFAIVNARLLAFSSLPALPPHHTIPAPLTTTA